MKKKRPAKQHFVLDIIPYRKEMFVCTGVTSYEELLRKQPKGAAKWYINWLEENKDSIEKNIKSSATGFVFFNTLKGGAVLFLRDYADTWNYWEVLMHELTHYIDFLGEQIGLDADHTEARAYLFEYLFHTIRRILQGIDPKP